MDYFVGFSNATYLCQTLFSNVPISYCIAQIIVLHIDLVSTEIRFIIDYKDVIIFFAKSFIKRTLYIVEIYQVIKLFTHTRLFFTAQD